MSIIKDNVLACTKRIGRFDSDQLRAYMKKLLVSTLQGMTWDPKDRENCKAWCKEIGERVKVRMLGELILDPKLLVSLLGDRDRTNRLVSVCARLSRPLTQYIAVNTSLRPK